MDAATTLYCRVDVRKTTVRAVITDGEGCQLQAWKLARNREGVRELLLRLKILQEVTLHGVIVEVPQGTTSLLCFGRPCFEENRALARVVVLDQMYFFEEILQEVQGENRLALLIAFLAREERMCRPRPIEPWHLDS